MLIGKDAWTKDNAKWLRSIARPLGKICNPDDLWKGQLHTELKQLSGIDKAIERVQGKLDKIGKADAQIQRLQTVAGVGPRAAEAIAAFIDNPHRFENAKQVGNYVGFTPRRYQSSDVDIYGKISKQGNKLLRSLLIEISWTALRYNPWARDTYSRLLKGDNKRKKAAIVALARKILVRCWAMMRDRTEWNQNITKAAA
jgi:transposase